MIPSQNGARIKIHNHARDMWGRRLAKAELRL